VLFSRFMMNPMLRQAQRLKKHLASRVNDSDLYDF